MNLPLGVAGVTSANKGVVKAPMEWFDNHSSVS